METKSDFIEFETNKGKLILIEVSRITHLSSDERLYTTFMPYIDMKEGEYDRIKKQLESRSKSI